MGALEAMRPERNPKHKSITAGDKRIPQPQLPPMEQMPMIDGPPVMMQPQMMPPQQPQMTEDMMMMGGMQDELSMIEQDLNMTRRATRPFIPSEDVGYFELQKQVHELETMPNTAIRPARFN